MHTQYACTQFLPLQATLSQKGTPSPWLRCPWCSPWPANGLCLLFLPRAESTLSLLWYTPPSFCLSFFELLQLQGPSGSGKTSLLCITVHSYAYTCIWCQDAPSLDQKELGFYIFQLGSHLRAGDNICGAANQIMSRALCILALWFLRELSSTRGPKLSGRKFSI